MIEFDGLQFNDLISKQIMESLAAHDAEFAEITHDQVQNRVTKAVFMAAIAQLNGLAFFPKVAEFCDGSLLEK
jgi:hypothetical protein